MNRALESLERLRALWLQIQGVQPKTAEYEALVKKIRAESDVHNARVAEEEEAARKR